MAMKVMLFEVGEEVLKPQYLGSLPSQASDTLIVLRNLIETNKLVEYAFDFWELGTSSRIRSKFEKLTLVEPEVYVIEILSSELGPSSKRRCIGSPIPLSPMANDDHWLDEPVGPDDVNLPPPISSNASNNKTAIEDDQTELSKPMLATRKDDLQSTLLSTDIVDRYLKAAVKLKSDLDVMSCEDHLWHIHSWDEGGKGYINIWCGECKKPYGNKDTDHRPGAITNMFGNFKAHHVIKMGHTKAYCLRNNIPYETHPHSEYNPSKKPVILSPEDHKRMLHDAIAVLENVNKDCSQDCGVRPYLLIGDPNREVVKCWIYKVKCAFCSGYYQQLVPRKNTLQANLENHMMSGKHLAKVAQWQEAQSATKAPGLNTGKRGRPSHAVNQDDKQQSVAELWAARGLGIGRSSVESGTVGQQRLLHLLCWGYWRSTCLYSGKTYSCKELLHDVGRGCSWVAEPSTVQTVFYEGKAYEISGCFRHDLCLRISKTLNPFPDLTCESCSRIPQENDFRKRALREFDAQEKRGTRDTGRGRRLGYLWHLELRSHSQKVNREVKIGRALIWLYKQRVCQLKMSRPGFKEAAQECVNRRDVLSFCNNIVQAHKVGKFGGRAALWDYLKDIGRNLNAKSSRGNRFSSNSLAFAQTLKLYGGKRMAEFVALNFGSPGLETIRRANRKGINIVGGEHVEIFRHLAAVYTKAKEHHNIVGDVPVMLSEDETKVKSSIRWSAKDDTLVGFCGDKTDHRCVSRFTLTVGSGQEGYSNLVHAFQIV